MTFVETYTGYICIDPLMTGETAHYALNFHYQSVAEKAKYKAVAHDVIIAIDGGSGMDGGKALALLTNNDSICGR